MIEVGPAARTFAFSGDYQEVDRYYQERGWTDGLPIIPPTAEAVAEFLRWTDRNAREVVAVLPPRQGEATVERIAANAVMAGCRPDYFPVIVAAIEALADPLFNLDVPTMCPGVPADVLQPLRQPADVEHGPVEVESDELEPHLRPRRARHPAGACWSSPNRAAG